MGKLNDFFNDDIDYGSKLDGVLTGAALKVSNIGSKVEKNEESSEKSTRGVIGKVRGAVGSILKFPFRHSAYMSQKKADRGSLLNVSAFLEFNKECESALDAKRLLSKLPRKESKRISNSQPYKDIEKIHQNILIGTGLGIAELFIEAPDLAASIAKYLPGDMLDVSPHVGKIEGAIHQGIDALTGGLYPSRLAETASEYRRAFPEIIDLWNEIGDMISNQSKQDNVVAFKEPKKAKKSKSEEAEAA